MRLIILGFLGVCINFIYSLTDIYWAHVISIHCSRHWKSNNELTFLPEGANEEGNHMIFLIPAERFSLREYTLGLHDFLHASISDIWKFGVIPPNESKTVVSLLPSRWLLGTSFGLRGFFSQWRKKTPPILRLLSHIAKAPGFQIFLGYFHCIHIVEKLREQN